MGMKRLIYKSRLVDGYGEIVEYVAFLLVFRDEIHLPVRLIEYEQGTVLCSLLITDLIVICRFTFCDKSSAFLSINQKINLTKLHKMLWLR